MRADGCTGWTSLTLLALLPLILCRAAPSYADPAVDRASLRSITRYDFGWLEGGSAVIRRFGGFLAAELPRVETHDVQSGLVWTMPVVENFGARLGVSGGVQRSDLDYDTFSFIASLEEELWAWSVVAGTDLFWRDPSIGFVELGYRFRHYSLDSTPDLEEDSHIGTLAAGLYFSGSGLSPDSGMPWAGLGLPPVDVNMRMTYERRSLEPGRLRRSGTIPEYSVEAVTNLYLGERVRVGLGARYAFADVSSIDDAWTRDTRALLELLWLPPIGGQPSIILGLLASGGELREKGFAGSYDRSVFSVGCEISVLYPGGDSLVKLFRRRL